MNAETQSLKQWAELHVTKGNVQAGQVLGLIEAYERLKVDAGILAQVPLDDRGRVIGFIMDKHMPMKRFVATTLTDREHDALAQELKNLRSTPKVLNPNGNEAR